MSQNLRVLHIEDRESDAALVIRHLEKSGYVVETERVEEAEPMRLALSRQDWDILIADYQLPRFNAVEALRIRNECAPELPFIVVSGTIGEDRAAEMMRAGAQDYVLKDRIARLGPAVVRETRAAQSRQDRRREQRRVEDRLRDRDAWLALVVSATQLGMFDFDPRSGALTLSEGGRRHLGLAPDAMPAIETILGAVHPDDRDETHALVRSAVDPAGSGELSAEFRVIGLTDQVERWLAAQGRAFFDAAGSATRFVGVTVDITQRKNLEDQFRQSQKLESVGMLAGGIAHDFNNMLQVISGYGQLALEDLTPDHAAHSKVEEVLTAAARAADLTRQLLAFSRRQPTQPEIILLNHRVMSVRKMLSRLIGEDITLDFSLAEDTGTVYADAGYIDQVLMNLAVNARDAMTNGGHLTIGTARRVMDSKSAALHPDLAPGPYAVLTVTDSGTGMSAEVKSHIFDPFFTTKGEGKGTGLGLSTVYGIVRQCGGAITVTSELGRGTTFTIYIPSVEPETTGVELKM